MYSASIENKGDSRSYATTGDYKFVIDTAGRGANPIDTVLAGLCGCMGHWVRNYLLAEHIDAAEFGVKAEAELTSGREQLCDISVVIDMLETKLDRHHGEALLKYVEGCPVHGTLKAGSRITIALTDLP